jgi:hypothetical protein
MKPPFGYLLVLYVVFGWLLPYLAVTYLPLIADLYLPPDDLPPPLLFFAIAPCSLLRAGCPARVTAPCDPTPGLYQAGRTTSRNGTLTRPGSAGQHA